MRKPNLSRTGERLVRLAYDLEDIAARLRDADMQGRADGVRKCSSILGDIGRDLDREIGRRAA